jgi:hypothetical protein
MEDHTFEGKKVFFLHPHSAVKDEIFDMLIEYGYEAYPVRDRDRAKRLLERFQGSIMFINIDEGLSEPEWELFIRDVLEYPDTRYTRLGVVTYNVDESLARKYLLDLGLPCGYVRLKLSVKESAAIILKTLEANEARGRRKFLRAFCEDDYDAKFTWKSNEHGIVSGNLVDISIANCTVRVDNFPAIPGKTILKNAELRFRTTRITMDVLFLGQRAELANVYIFLFVPNMRPEYKGELYHYIKERLRHYIENLDLQIGRMWGRVR